MTMLPGTKMAKMLGSGRSFIGLHLRDLPSFKQGFELLSLDS